MKIRVSELRHAIHDTHDCKADTLAEVIHVTARRANASPWETDVYVFEISGHPTTDRCYAWVEPVNETKIIIRCILHSDQIASAESAVQSILNSE